MPCLPPPNRRRQRGLTLPELLTTLTVLGITTTVGVPSLGRMVSDHRAATRVNALVGALALARSEAVSSAREVGVCPYTDTGAADPATRYVCTDTTDWSGGWVVYRNAIDEAGQPSAGREIVRVIEPPASDSALSGPDHPLRFLPSGFLAEASAVDGVAPQFALVPAACAARPKLRRITVTLQGQSQLDVGPIDAPAC